MSAQKISDNVACQFKGSLFTLTVLKVFTSDQARLQQDIAKTITKAPQFFQHAPIILDVNAIAGKDFDYRCLVDWLRQQHIIPVGVRGIDKRHSENAVAAGLALLPNTQQSETKQTTTTSPSQAAPKPVQANTSMIIDQPVRSGQQIYAKNSDLIVTNSVSHGAELLADGNIHVYGTLRGRALAGINGNQQARIFCHNLSAELLSIAGLYQLSDDFSSHQNKKNIQVLIENDCLNIKTLD